uniref:Uncharacterized protein n=1 Tax=Morchella brunnea TaxID=1174671 RepID=A0A8K1I7Q6_9PEZI|nr:hypothetical protein LK370_mgp016 [Morchella brunnea]UBU98411.1 hypothetical protein [Morchella brunnea]
MCVALVAPSKFQLQMYVYICSCNQGRIILIPCGQRSCCWPLEYAGGWESIVDIYAPTLIIFFLLNMIKPTLLYIYIVYTVIIQLERGARPARPLASGPLRGPLA